MQQHFTYEANAKISKNCFGLEEKNIQENQTLLDLSFLTPMKASFKNEDNSEIENMLVYLDFLNEQVFDFQLQIINDTKLGQQIIERIKLQKNQKQNLAKVPFDIIQRAIQVREEKNKMQQDDYYGKN